MTQLEQVAADLRFVRGAVEAQSRRPPPRALPIIWACYTLIGYTLIDLAPRAAGWFFMIAGIAGGLLSYVIARRSSRAAGEIKRTEDLHHFLGALACIYVAIAAALGLAAVIPALRGIGASQVLVVIIGMIYFQAGIFGPAEMRYMRWGGPVVIAGGICVGLVPHYGWTSLGALIAGVILMPLFRRGPAGNSPTPVA